MSLSRDMRLAEDQVTLRAPLLLFALWALLAPVQGSQGRPSWRYISSEVVIPKKELHHGKGVQMPGWLSYSLHFGGKSHVIHMRHKKLFWSRHLLMMTQDDQGALQMDYLFIPPDCYYLGYLEEIPLSMVTMDTCFGGLEGIMKLDDLAYEIRPLSDSQRFEHVVSQIVADTNATGPTYNLGYKEVRNPLFSQANISAAPRISSKLYSSHHGILKRLVLGSKTMYGVFNNVSKCARFLIRLVSLTDSMLQGIDVRHYISSMVIYNLEDPVVLNNFQVPESPIHIYFQRHLFVAFKPHTALLMNKDAPHELQFQPATYAVCGSKSIISLASLGRHFLLLSVLVAQKIALSIGIFYDNQFCACQRRSTCIMNQYPIMTDSFSNCSFIHMQHVVVNNFCECIFDSGLSYFNKSLTHNRCGNYVVEPGEQCDCGSFKQCYNNPCCTTDCILTPGSKCNTGRCCTNCTYSDAGTLCRPIQNICDLPEYSRGGSMECPDDFYMQDGTPCTEEGYCYHGNCTDRTMHCQEIFGRNAVKGENVCYTINQKGSRYGHCRRDPGVFKSKPCSPTDMQCGRLQCSNVTHLPQLQEHVGFHQSEISGFWCFGLDSHRSTGTTNIGHVRTGTPCAPGKFCQDTYCNDSEAQLNYDCIPEKCSHRGIYNNNRNCHCHVGWDPPRYTERGTGGSTDSGPPPRRMRSVRQSRESMVYLRVIFARIYVLIAAFLFGVAGNVRTINRQKVTEETVDQDNA
ncbi:disintegrin and metalloproteinase domain-containing protein 21-like [Neofelis nebulosa]|uniref:disintegrin and metalloproteinase domain-containing protein 21-like n=1 Tax=Neofelis nebulosa TaxID=61452 RepID=UPI00272B958D|nr:disintegrin and metalloproteinase domain-containing protein 21-like [Neofelis nebulosa]